MIILKTAAELRAWRNSLPGTLGFVPTMGSLHAGHLALVERALSDNANTAVSIFVNPTQFNDTTDYDRYPRDYDQDMEMLRDLGVDAIIIPAKEEIYPPGDVTTIRVGGLAALWEGAHRPGHFDGVATVVAKLLNLVNAERAYFGEKDYQQLQIIERLVTDLRLGVEIVSCPIVRAADGLALSSRNALLDEHARVQATELIRSLQHVLVEIEGGGLVDAVLTAARAKLDATGWLVDYLALIDGTTMDPITAVESGARLIVAATLGGVRLIDNISAER